MRGMRGNATDPAALVDADVEIGAPSPTLTGGLAELVKARGRAWGTNTCSQPLIFLEINSKLPSSSSPVTFNENTPAE